MLDYIHVFTNTRLKKGANLLWKLWCVKSKRKFIFWVITSPGQKGNYTDVGQIVAVPEWKASGEYQGNGVLIWTLPRFVPKFDTQIHKIFKICTTIQFPWTWSAFKAPIHLNNVIIMLSYFIYLGSLLLGICTMDSGQCPWT